MIAIGWIAAMKVTEYESKGIEPLIAHSPFVSWGYSVWTVHHFTEIIGAVEMTIAILIALRRWFPKASADRECGSTLYVSHHTVVHPIDSGLGAKSGRLSCSIGRCRGISDQGFHIARRRDSGRWLIL